jgi:two-component system OmpR family response regulator
MLTAKDGEYDQTDAFELGADDYVTKPFSTPVLLARLQALARRGAPERPVALTAGNLSLDPTTRRVIRQGREIQLTAREYALLHHLMRKVGQVQSKAEILENVWDSDYPGADNVVEVYIGYLRRKIDAPFDAKAIETVRGMGYRLNPVHGPAEA